jgi:predicted TIM-barrel fold metal-dependent hydrolase
LRRKLDIRYIGLLLTLTLTGCRHPAAPPVAGPFSSTELQQFSSLGPIDAHAHVFVSDPNFYAMLKRLNLHMLDILVVDDTNPAGNSLAGESQAAWTVAHGARGRVSICTTFDPYFANEPGFAAAAIRQINEDFSRGAVAVKIWKNIGMEIKDAKGNYLLPDSAIFAPVYKDIAAQNKTLIMHTADPNAAWLPPDPKVQSAYYRNNPQWYMYSIPGAPAKEQILAARDHVLEQNPNLRVVGAHLGSMESDLDQLSQHLDRYPNFAVDLAARIRYLMPRPRAQMIAFFTKYQDRLIYGTDHELGYGEKDIPGKKPDWEEEYARDWRYLATADTLNFTGHTIQGLSLPPAVLRKIYHDNALKWFPQILTAPQ